jgi:hypothetical protein
VNRLARGLVVAALHLTLVASLGAKLLVDRATRPRVWVQAAPYDPSLPIRGRYVSVQLQVELRGASSSGAERMPPVAVTLRAEGDRLVAEQNERQRYDPSDLHARFLRRGDQTLAVLDQPVAFFIPEHAVDPSRRPPGEQLWVEATIPRKGPPRPIRLGVSKDGGPIEPLDLD